MSSLNTKRMVGEIASRFGIRLDEADPAFVIVRLSQLVLEEASEQLIERASTNLREFEAAVEKVQTRAGRYVAAEFNEGAAALRRELENDIGRAGVRAAELVEKVHRAHTRATLIRWICVGLLAGIGLLAAGAWIGAHWS
jgi:CHASE3 domain sensor protein